MIESVYITESICGYIGSVYLYCRFNTGGVTGGSCWGGDTYEYEGEDVDYDVFDYLLYNIFEDNDILERIKKDYINEERETDIEMYGNRSNISYLFIDLISLYENFISIKAQRLKKLNIIFNNQ